MRKRSGLLVLLIVTGVLFMANWYIIQGLRTLTVNVEQAGMVEDGYAFFIIALVFLFFVSLFRGRSQGKFTPFARIVFHLFLIVLITQLVFFAVLFAEDVFRVTFSLFNGFVLPGRNKIVSELGFGLAGIPLVSFIYGMTKGKQNYKVHRHTLYFDDLPEAFDGFTITQISDVHAGSFGDPVAVQKGINLVNAQKSDLFVFTGDLVNNKAEEIEPWIDSFRKIEAPYGKFAILGNHDYGDYIPWNSLQEKGENLERLQQHHISLGHKLLLDENAVIEKNGQRIMLLGVENWGKGFGERGDLERALYGVHRNDFKILLSHDPSHWDEQVKEHQSKIHLTLSGHTHGMQFGIELPGIRWSPVKYRYPNWAGVTSYNGRYLNVNRGFGYLGFEGRVGIWPEVTVIELRRGKEPSLK